MEWTAEDFGRGALHGLETMLQKYIYELSGRRISDGEAETILRSDTVVVDAARFLAGKAMISGVRFVNDAREEKEWAEKLT